MSVVAGRGCWLYHYLGAVDKAVPVLARCLFGFCPPCDADFFAVDSRLHLRPGGGHEVVLQLRALFNSRFEEEEEPPTRESTEGDEEVDKGVSYYINIENPLEQVHILNIVRV